MGRDLWQPYRKVITQKAWQALHIPGRFHRVARSPRRLACGELNQASDDGRAAEAQELARAGYQPVRTHSRGCFRKRPENRTPKQRTRLDDWRRYGRQTVRAQLRKESLQAWWEYTSQHGAGCFLDGWRKRARRSRRAPVQKVARSRRTHQTLILNWFAAKQEFSAGILEGLNCRVKLTLRKAYGFRTLAAAEIALSHALGRLPEPKLAHEFC